MQFNNKLIESAILTISALCIFTSAQAATQQATKAMLISAKNSIVNLDRVLLDVKAKTHIPVLFPAQVPATTTSQKYYASSVVGADGNNYVITIGTKPDCNGMKYCNVGTISGTMGQRPQIYAAMHGPDLTEPMELIGDHRGYFTPAHAEGDFWPGMIEWRIENILYSIAWKLNPAEEKQMLVAVTNSAIQASK